MQYFVSLWLKYVDEVFVILYANKSNIDDVHNFLTFPLRHESDIIHNLIGKKKLVK